MLSCNVSVGVQNNLTKSVNRLCRKRIRESTIYTCISSKELEREKIIT